MSPIEPGTLCLIVQDATGRVPRAYVGRTCTVIARETWRCHCGADSYRVTVFGEVDYGCRTILRPILPPGVDVSAPRVEPVEEHVA